jgi:processive 1,2-diacylglycerol beta-glucosyltransferase
MGSTELLDAPRQLQCDHAMGKRYLVLSASVGAGHMRAAQAVELALKESSPSSVVKNVDVLSLTNAAFRKLYGETYLDLVNKAPHVLGYMYEMMDRPRKADSKREKLRLAAEKINLKKLTKMLKEETWDVVVNTHFLPAELIASMRKDGELDLPQMTVTTDFETHRLWVNEPCDFYTTATEEGALYLEHWGIDRKKIRATGIPIHPVFAVEKPREGCLKRMGLKGDRPVVLQLAGGFGVGPIEELFEAILAVETGLEVVVVAGKNAAVKEKLEKIKPPPRHRVKVMGFTDQMDELMAAADLVVSKPGGLTTSEVLARGAAMVVVNPIPGQESRNSDFLLENGAAIKINNIATMSHKLSGLLGDEGKLKRLKENARRLGRPRAAFDVARLAMEMAGE